MKKVAVDALKIWARDPISRRSLLSFAALSVLASSGIGKALGVSAPLLTQILGRPTNSSIAINLLSTENLSAVVEYGYIKNKFSYTSKNYLVTSNNPEVIELQNLKSNSIVYYRIKYKLESDAEFNVGKSYSFATQRKIGTNFAFTVQGDTHPERAGKMFNAELYGVTLSNIAIQKPDFHVLIGDDFSIDPLIDKGQANQSNVESVYRTHRNWLSFVGNSIPIYLVNGNHEQAAAYLLDGTESNPAVLAGRARLKYFALPEPNDFYTGDEFIVPGVGLPRDYYSWSWGDALFVTLDPYWHSKNPVDNVAGKVAGKSTNLWEIGIGDEQYLWLIKTLEESNAKFKFVFAHHVMGTGRGAIEVSTNYEWGGKDPKGQSTFEKERPNWELPIHDLMVKNKVSIFFQGHDHIFCTQQRDGLIYQSLPNPADDTFTMFNSDAYLSGKKAPNSGHVRVSVSSTQAKVEYFLAARKSDSTRKNLTIAHSYTIKPKVNK
jgi:hypothetical protein